MSLVGKLVNKHMNETKEELSMIDFAFGVAVGIILTAIAIWWFDQNNGGYDGWA